MSAILDFYRDEHSWDKNVPLNPSGYSHFDIVRNWSDDKWEGIHDFIQWIFPLKEPSNFNPDAPLLTDEDIAIFRADSELRGAVFLSFHRFLRFLGLRCLWYVPKFDGESLAEPYWKTEPIQANENGPGDEFLTVAEVEKKFKVWEHPNHNWLRITRCLHSLRLLGLEYAATSLFDALCKIYDSNTGITPDTFQYWQEAAQGGLE